MKIKRICDKNKYMISMCVCVCAYVWIYEIFIRSDDVMMEEKVFCFLRKRKVIWLWISPLMYFYLISINRWNIQWHKFDDISYIWCTTLVIRFLWQESLICVYIKLKMCECVLREQTIMLLILSSLSWAFTFRVMNCWKLFQV